MGQPCNHCNNQFTVNPCPVCGGAGKQPNVEPCAVVVVRNLIALQVWAGPPLDWTTDLSKAKEYATEQSALDAITNIYGAEEATTMLKDSLPRPYRQCRGIEACKAILGTSGDPSRHIQAQGMAREAMRLGCSGEDALKGVLKDGVLICPHCGESDFNGWSNAIQIYAYSMENGKILMGYKHTNAEEPTFLFCNNADCPCEKLFIPDDIEVDFC